MKMSQLTLDSIDIENIDKKKSVEIKEKVNKEIAIIGMGVRLPNAANVNQFWSNISNGIDCLKKIPNKRKKDINDYLNYLNTSSEDYRYLKTSYIEDIDMFDYNFFDLSPKEASLMNPLQRLFLEVAWETIEDAGYAGKIYGSKTGLYMGLIGDIDSYKYKEMIYKVDPNLLPQSVAGNLASMIPSRFSYLLNLKGPSMLIDTACSSSLVAVDTACKALRNGVCDMALASGGRLRIIPLEEEYFKFGIESSDGLTRAFDQNSDGTGFGEGIIAVMLKPLNKAIRDKDNIYAVIKGSAVNQDGTSMGITAPNPLSQERVLIDAWQDANINPETLSYIEAHGTGTKLGDVIELDALKNAFKKYTDKKQFCAIGSVKSNIGHLYESSGITGLIKTILMIKHREIPPTLYLNIPNKKINFIDSPIYINKKVRTIEEKDKVKLRMGISSFGLSGTNCHVVIEEPPKVNVHDNYEDLNIFTLSSKSKTSLLSQIKKFDNFLNNNICIEDLCYTLNIGRIHYNYRLAIVARNMNELREKLHYLAGESLNNINVNGMYFNLNKNKKNIYNSEISEEEKKQLDINADKKVDELLESNDNSQILINELINLYIMGANIKWEKYYSRNSYHKISIPKYAFDRKRCWLQIPKSKKLESLYYKVEWEKENLESIEKINIEGKGIIIIHDLLGIGKSISNVMKQSNYVIDVSFSDKFAKIDDCTYTIDKTESSYYKLLSSINKIDFSYIIHLSSITNRNKINSIDELKESQDKGVYSLLYLCKVINKYCNNNINLLLVSQNVNDVTGFESKLNPEGSTMFGFGKVINQEIGNIRCKGIDIDDNITTNEIIKQIFSNSKHYLTAYRNGDKYIERFSEGNYTNTARNAIKIRENGVYIVTGGLGNIGIEVSKSLAKNNVKLILINRSKLPHVVNSKSLKDLKDKDIKSYDRINAINEIKSLGSEIFYYSADVSDFQQMKELMDEIHKKFGSINGIIHTAGVAGKGFIISKDKDTFEKVLKPKVDGTWILDKLTEEDNLDFFVLFSSGISLIGEIGQSDYTAANSYLDSFAAYRDKLHKKTLSVNWVIWQGARMGKGKSVNIDGIFKPMPIDKGINALYDVLSMDINRVLVGELNYKSRFVKNILNIPMKISDDLKQKILKIKTGREFYNEIEKDNREKVKLIGKNSGRYSEVEKQLASIYQKVLGYKEININDSFFDIGGDSILLNTLNVEIQKKFPGKLAVADLFTYTSIAKLAKFISCDDDKEYNKVIVNKKTKDINQNNIAVIGMSAILPLADNVYEFWNNIKNGIDCTRRIPLNRKESAIAYAKFTDEISVDKFIEAGYIDNIDEFDYEFFKLSPKEASLTDPVQRLAMKTVWHSIEDAGYSREMIYGSNTGIYFGYANIIRDAYQKIIDDIDSSLISSSVVGNTAAMLPSRISYLLNLKGPAMIIDTACSSALVAVHTACKAIINGDCSLAIAGGAKLFLAPFDREYYKIGIESSDGKTRSFDNNSDGSAMGEGVGAILLKPLEKAIEDKDNIYAVIKGSAINQDGASNGITAPSPKAQTNVILKAWENACINPEEIVHIEAHGTATKLGDPIEIQGITNAFKKVTDKKQFCSISTAKSNIGHTNECAGVVGLIKTILILKNREIPPTINFYNPNRKIDFNNSPVYINNKLRKIEANDKPMLCAVSAFGFSGTNCHMVLEEAPKINVIDNYRDNKCNINMLTLSAVSKQSLERLIDEYLIYAKNNQELVITQLCYSQNTTRGHYPYRAALIISNYDELLEKLTLFKNIKVDFLSNNQNLYYGRHKIVLESKEVKQQYEITQEYKDLLNQKAARLINKFKKHKKLIDAQEICNLYVQGASINWELLYQKDNLQKIRVPKYPFERNKLWIDIPIRDNLKKDGKQLYYKINWIQRENNELENDLSDDVIVFFTGEDVKAQNIINSLRNDCKDIIEVLIGTNYCKINNNKYVLRNNQEDYNKFIIEMKNRKVNKIIHTLSMSKLHNIANINDLNNSQKNGVYSLFYLNKVLFKNSNEPNIDLIVLGKQTMMVDGNEQLLMPENATLYGFGKVVNREQTNIKCRCIDIDDNTDINLIIKEIKKNTDKSLTAYRNNKRYVEIIDRVDIESEEKENIKIKAQGVYVITGGLGGIGTEVAKFLAVSNKVKLALVGRQKIPNRDKWDLILKEKENTEICKKINRIREIEALGAEIKYFSINICNEKEVSTLMQDLRAEYGNINGIVHGAGIGGYKTIDMMEEDYLTKTLMPKVHGTWLLGRLTEKDDLDFFIMFSSIATILYSIGQADYVAANSYLDAYADLKSKYSKKTMTINWSTWKETGMAFEQNFNFDTIFKTIKTKDAINCLNKALNTKISRVLVGKINDNDNMIKMLRSYSYELNDYLKEKINKNSKCYQAKVIKKANIKLKGRNSNNYSDLEKMIAQICKETMGFDEINIYDSFFEMGADSILIKQIHRKLNEYFQEEIAVTDIFQYPTISKLSSFIGNKIFNNKPIDIDKDKNSEGNFKKVSIKENLNNMLEDNSLTVDEIVENIQKM